MKIVVLGAGYVGLVSAACFAEFGVQVRCIDPDVTKIEALRGGKIPIYEPGLDDLVAKNIARGHLSFAETIHGQLAGVDAVFIAVGTPSRRGDGHADLQYVFAAVDQIADEMTTPLVVVTKSTVPVGTGRKVAARLRAQKPGADVHVCSNPEFLREGSAINDFMRPDRVVLGLETDHADSVMRALYRPLNLNETPMVVTTLESAELIKYAANAFLATKITFINEMADVCERVGADVQEVARGMGLDGRIGRKFLHAGPGFGGSCFPKDTRALVLTAEEVGAPTRLVEAVVAVNENRKRAMAQRVVRVCGGSVAGKTIGVLGVTFKPNTDDVRESVSLTVIPLLQEAGATIRAYDPAGMEEAAKHLSHVTWCRDAYDVASGSDALLLLTEWNEFRGLDLARLLAAMRAPVIIDTRNALKLDAKQFPHVVYDAVGKG